MHRVNTDPVDIRVRRRRPYPPNRQTARTRVSSKTVCPAYPVGTASRSGLRQDPAATPPTTVVGCRQRTRIYRSRIRSRSA
jgi:transposase